MPESRRNPRVTPWEDVNRHIYSALIDLPAHDLETRQALEAMLTDHHIHFRTTPKQPCKRRYSVPTVDLCCARSVLLALEYQESGAGGGA